MNQSIMLDWIQTSHQQRSRPPSIFLNLNPKDVDKATCQKLLDAALAYGTCHHVLNPCSIVYVPTTDSLEYYSTT